MDLLLDASAGHREGTGLSCRMPFTCPLPERHRMQHKKQQTDLGKQPTEMPCYNRNISGFDISRHSHFFADHTAFHVSKVAKPFDSCQGFYKIYFKI
ncbi:MAG: hypothetical protein MI742_01255 [Desulfobacterales bacterium]|nr:hypothetical protein [Desulfobacterales bacterium]